VDLVGKLVDSVSKCVCVCVDYKLGVNKVYCVTRSQLEFGMTQFVCMNVCVL